MIVALCLLQSQVSVSPKTRGEAAPRNVQEERKLPVFPTVKDSRVRRGGGEQSEGLFISEKQQTSPVKKNKPFTLQGC